MLNTLQINPKKLYLIDFSSSCQYVSTIPEKKLYVTDLWKIDIL